MTGQKLVQLDLFGEEDAKLAAAAAKREEAAAWRARFTQADWVAPWDCGYGPAGTRVPGWQCPDPDCGEIEPNAGLLHMNHGYDPDVPGLEPWNGRCAMLTRAQLRREAGDDDA